jgi:GNAT superfamily N-acetyltransferase
MHVAVTPLDPADHVGVDRAYEICRAATDADLPDLPAPGRRYFVAGVRHPWPGRPRMLALGRLAGRPVGVLQVELPDRAGVDHAAAKIHVLSAFRRLGVGRALHAYAVQLSHAHGRRRLGGFSAPDGAGFAAAVGARAVLRETRSRLDADELDGVCAGEPACPPAGYRLACWRGPAPAEHLEDLARLQQRRFADARGDRQAPPDGRLVREREAARELRGRLDYSTGVLHEASGRLVGWATLACHMSEPWHAWQSDTVVDPQHRGRGLGLLLKTENLRYARWHEPALTTVDTYHTVADAPMTSINATIGFHPVDTRTHWQHPL